MMIHEAQFCISAKSLLRPFITFLFHDLYTFRMPLFSFGLSELYTPLWFGVLFCSEGSSTVIVSLQVPGRNHLLLFTLADTVSLPLIFLCGPSTKESICQCRRHKRHGFDPWVGKILWSRKWQPAPAFLPGESHGQRSLVSYSPWGCKESDMTEATEHISYC